MKILITGGGGREHALALKLAESKKIERIYCAPGNGATALMDKCENIQAESLDELAVFAEKNHIDLTIPGAEDLLPRVGPQSPVQTIDTGRVVLVTDRVQVREDVFETELTPPFETGQ